MNIAYPSHRRVKDMVASERPQERLENLGVEALSDRELLAMILRTGTPGIDVLSMSEDLLHEAGSSPICFAGRQKTSVKFMALVRLRHSS